MKPQAGFTLVELVTIIVILGVLAAFAIPRFTGLETNARVALVNGMAGNLRSGGQFAHSIWVANGNPAATSVILSGTTNTVLVDAYGYPTAAATSGIQATLENISGFTATYASPTLTLTRTGAATPANCTVTYTGGTAASNSPTITVTLSGC